MTQTDQSKGYQKTRQALQLLGLFLNPAILLLIAASPLSHSFKTLAQSVSSQDFVIAVIYFLIYSLFVLAVNFPLTVYSGYSLEKQYGLSNHTWGSWLSDFLKKTVLSTLFSLGLVLALYTLIRHYPENWWFLAWAGFALVSFVVGKIFPVFIVPLFYKYGKVEEGTLKKRIFDLSARYGLPIENLYSLNLSRTTKKANAAFMGIGKTKRVVLSDTLLENFTEDEIEAVVAHELGHFKHKDIWKQLTVGMAGSFAGFWLVFHFLTPAAQAFDYGGAADIAALPVLFLLFYAFHLCLMPIQNGFSRMIERAADRFALQAFPNRDAFISCMEKLASVNLADRDPHPLYEWFFYDHPAIGKRVKMAREYQG